MATDNVNDTTTPAEREVKQALDALRESSSGHELDAILHEMFLGGEDDQYAELDAWLAKLPGVATDIGAQAQIAALLNIGYAYDSVIPCPEGFEDDWLGVRRAIIDALRLWVAQRLDSASR